MNVEIGNEASEFQEKEYIRLDFVASDIPQSTLQREGGGGGALIDIHCKKLKLITMGRECSRAFKNKLTFTKQRIRVRPHFRFGSEI